MYVLLKTHTRTHRAFACQGVNKASTQYEVRKDYLAELFGVKSLALTKPKLVGSSLASSSLEHVVVALCLNICVAWCSSKMVSCALPAGQLVYVHTLVWQPCDHKDAAAVSEVLQGKQVDNRAPCGSGCW